MAFTTWKTWSSGDVLTAADMNAYVRDNGKWLSHDTTNGAPIAHARQDTAQTITDTTVTQIEFDAEEFDDMAMHDNVTNNQRLTVPSGGGGIYLIGAHIGWSANAVGLRQARLQVNGSSQSSAISGNSGATFPTNIVLAMIWSAAAADYFTVAGWHNKGSDLDTTVGSTHNKSRLWCSWIGEET